MNSKKMMKKKMMMKKMMMMKKKEMLLMMNISKLNQLIPIEEEILQILEEEEMVPIFSTAFSVAMVPMVPIPMWDTWYQ